MEINNPKLLSKISIIIIFVFIIIQKIYFNDKVIDFSLLIKNYNNYYNKTYSKYKKINNNYLKKNGILLFNEKNKNVNKEFSLEINAAICVIAKQENLYIREFIDYYKDLGIKKIILYDNNDLEGENFNDILNDEIIKGFIEIIDYRGKISPQIKVYNDCYENNKNKYDWIAFYDVDEYLYLENYTNINEFLSLPIFNNCSSILINWRYYGDNNNIYYEPKPLKTRFSVPFNFLKNRIYDKYFFSASKSIIKGGLNISWAHFPHFLNDSFICRPNGSKVMDPFSQPQYSQAYIKHYATKSIEEYIFKFFKGNVYTNKHFNIESLIFWIKDYFFLFNKITTRKIKLIKTILKFNIYKYLKK